MNGFRTLSFFCLLFHFFSLRTFSVCVLDMPQLSLKIGSCVNEKHLVSGRVGSGETSARFDLLKNHATPINKPTPEHPPFCPASPVFTWVKTRFVDLDYVGYYDLRFKERTFPSASSTRAKLTTIPSL